MASMDDPYALKLPVMASSASLGGLDAVLAGVLTGKGRAISTDLVHRVLVLPDIAGPLHAHVLRGHIHTPVS